MVEKETVFSSKMKYNGIFLFRDFYKFCYDWLIDEPQFLIAETKYVEKLTGDSKNIDIIWEGKKKVTDYFQFKIKLVYRIIGLKNVEIVQEGVKTQTNQGEVELKLKGELARDYEGKFERNALQKFLRSIYEKWVIPSRLEQFETDLIRACDEFLSQAKAWLDLEGKR
jgi:hypothetical protein